MSSRDNSVLTMSSFTCPTKMVDVRTAGMLLWAKTAPIEQLWRVLMSSRMSSLSIYILIVNQKSSIKARGFAIVFSCLPLYCFYFLFYNFADHHFGHYSFFNRRRFWKSPQILKSGRPQIKCLAVFAGAL